MTGRARLILRADADKWLLMQAEPYEVRFGVAFDTFAIFHQEYLADLHRPFSDKPARSSPDCSQGLVDDATALEMLTQIANLSSPSLNERQDYLDALLGTYKKFPCQPKFDVNGIVIAPQREGMLLAQRLGWLPASALCPNMKRIPFNQGLVIGVSGLQISRTKYASCSIIDGAVASASTVMTLMELLHPWVQRFELFTVHATPQSLYALQRYSEQLETSILVRAGYVTGELNNKFYAVDNSISNTVLVGDLGDMISIIEEGVGSHD